MAKNIDDVYFSVIVPVYKVEKYLKECVDSVLSQKNGDFELILVDDGSPDGCPAICDGFAKADSRVKVIHQKNKGLSGARNAGMRKACGQYIVFLDSDDKMCSDALQKMKEALVQSKYPDMLIGNITHWDGEKKWIVFDNSRIVDSCEGKTIVQMNELYAKAKAQLPWRAYQSIYKRDFLLKYALIYNEHLIGAEDCDFYLDCIQCIDSYALIKDSFVLYRYSREGSVINTPSFASVLGQLKTFAKAFALADIFPDTALMKQYFSDKFTNIIILVQRLENEKDREVCYSYVEKNAHIIKYTSHTAKYLVARAVWRMFGFARGSQFLLALKK